MKPSSEKEEIFLRAPSKPVSVETLKSANTESEEVRDHHFQNNHAISFDQLRALLGELNKYTASIHRQKVDFQ